MTAAATLVGRVAWVFGDHFDVDDIVGVENIRTFDLDILSRACMAEFAPRFVEEVRPGDFLVAGRNLGFGHPHDQPMLVMRHLGIGTILAESFAPTFARSETFNGMRLLAVPGIRGAVERGDALEVDWEDATVRVQRTGQVLRGEPPSARAVAIVNSGGGPSLLHRQMEASASAGD